GRSPEYARNFEDLIGEDMENLQQKLDDAAGSIGKPRETRVTEAIDQTRDLVRNLESLSERIRERAEQGSAGDEGSEKGKSGEQKQNARRGLKPGSEGEQGQGESSEDASSQGEPGQGEPREARGGLKPGGSQDTGGGEAFIGAGSPNGPNYQPGTFSTEEIRQLRSEFRERVSEAEKLREELARQNLDVPDLNEIIRRMEEFDRKQIYLNPLGLEQLEEGVVADLKQFEYWLRRELEGIGEGELYLAGSDQVPSDYRQMVEEYFRSLSRNRN
ncbi:MAG TPA: hypothetical protein VIG29_10980, partial [Vicinamibacteria bacterium]